jgi:F1F0 ATPase subunit 2
MNDTAWTYILRLLCIAFAAGMLIGMFYFRLLWATVKRLHQARRPALLITGSFIFRLIVVLAGFYLVMAGRWEPLVASLCGFLLMREILIRRLGNSK